MLVAAVVVGRVPQLCAYYGDPAYWREDFRRAAAYVEDASVPNDVVVLVGSYQPIMQYYKGQAKVVRFPAGGDSIQDGSEVVEALNKVVTPQAQVRVVMYSWETVDPQGLVEAALRLQCDLQGEHWQRETGQRPIRVLNYAQCQRLRIEPRVPVDAVLGDQIALTGYRLDRFAPGRQAHVILWWRALVRPRRNYSAFVHLVGADGEIIAQYDHLPLNSYYPMLAWPVGVDQRDATTLDLPQDASLEGAWLAVGMYNLGSMRRLDVLVDGEPVGDAVRIPLE
jgi:hypothetical protein